MLPEEQAALPHLISMALGEIFRIVLSRLAKRFTHRMINHVLVSNSMFYHPKVLTLGELKQHFDRCIELFYLKCCC